MAANNTTKVILDSLLEEFGASEYPGENADEVFELFAATQVLKPKELSAEELEQGIVDGEKDGGIDGFYVFLNDRRVTAEDPLLVKGDPSIASLGSYPKLEVVLTQSKNETRWRESVWEHLLASLPDLLSISSNDEALEHHYRVDVVAQTGILRKLIDSLGTKFPRVSFRAVYVSLAAENNVTSTISRRAEKVKDLVKSQLTVGANVTVEHVGVETLYTLASTSYAHTGELKFRNLVREKDSFIGVVEIEDYLAFVRNEADELREELFESNVRDYEGDNTVNSAIAETLAHPGEAEFWWLNNGVTVLGDEVSSPQNLMTVLNPLIVNGLQTSHVLHNAAKNDVLAMERLHDGVLVRVIQSSDEDVRDQIIAGTNRQTQVPNPALYATQPLQREIERYLLVHDWFYERRKNRYRNLKKPAKRRISINLLAQAMITLMLGHPDVARARPSTVLGTPEGYASIFPEGLNQSAYLSAVELVKAVDEFLSTDEAKDILDEYSNSRFYVVAGYAVLRLNLKSADAFHFDKNYSKLSGPPRKQLLVEALTVLDSTAAEFGAKNPKSSRDTIFKNSEFRDQYFAALQRS